VIQDFLFLKYPHQINRLPIKTPRYRNEKIACDHLNENIADTNQTKMNEILEEVKPIMIETVFPSCS
jgi:hypothetical protein